MTHENKPDEQCTWDLREARRKITFNIEENSRLDNSYDQGMDYHDDTNAKKTRSSDGLRKTQEHEDFKPKIIWSTLIGILFVHFGCLYGLYLLIASKNIKSFIWLFVSIYTSGFGITAGVHRLWSHRAYRANYPLRLILLFLFTICGQRDVYAWVLDHRVHHKYTETDADPHNAKRGFLFSHVGWLVLTPHPKVIEKRNQIDMSDLEADPLVMWQKKYNVPLFLALAVALPVVIPWYAWNESLWTSFWINFNARYCITLNIAFFVNSVAHLWGRRPYDKNMKSADNLSVSIAALGEGWHNYHHVFPYDYKTGELGNYTLNLTTGFIDFFAKIGWATDRKSVSDEIVKRRKEKTGDGSNPWGWTDQSLEQDQKE